MSHFDKFENNTWNFIRDYYYIYRYQIDNNFDPSKNQITTILKTI